MVEFDIESLRETFQNQGWTITDAVTSPSKSITARTPMDIQVSIDEPVPDLNNLFIKSPQFEIHTLQDYNRAKELTPENITVMVTGLTYTQVMSLPGDTPEKETVISRIAETDSETVGFYFAFTDVSSEVSMNEIIESVEQVKSCMTEF